MDDIRDFHWTTTGASHLAKSKVCEDASLSISQKDFVIAASADGHGAGYCFRSQTGSKLAVDAAWRNLHMFMQEARDQNSAEWFGDEEKKKQLQEKLAQKIVQDWQESVAQDMQSNPVTFRELASNQLYTLNASALQENPLIYGTTLLFAAMNEDILLLGQQGDGRIVVLLEDGTLKMPVPWDHRCYKNVTTSMCDIDADMSMRFAWINVKENPVAAVFLATDGIEDSFPGFEEMYDFLLELIVGFYQNRNSFDEYLAQRLARLSQEGSLDDVSVSGFFNIPALKKIYRQIELKVSFQQAQNQLDLVRHNLYMLSKEKKNAQGEEKEKIEQLYQQGSREYALIRNTMKDLYDKMVKGSTQE